MLNKELESSLNGAFARARDKRHEFMTVEHLLLALLENNAAKKLFWRAKPISMLCDMNWMCSLIRQLLLFQTMMKLGKLNLH